ncbi:unnamed protein product [Cyprideis torosa]|uniref:3-isopropylmalate dehydrogenase n=1 Tax=Cyprideis torosa TaxID=163714 RepID=A0A7R8WSZ0_9CRUS|nr:unnamed protein product [Cyprideis torosa]CAG0905578.1 unnamed protein product [Cyprideis torosa]
MKLKIALLAGDGIGPEVIEQAVKVSDAVAKKFNHEITWTPALTGAAAIDAVGDPYPPETHDICASSDAVLFGAIGDPKYDNDPSAKVRPEQGLLRMRKALGLFANVRPTFTFPSLIDKSPLKKERIEGTDLVFLRELTGGIYFGKKDAVAMRLVQWPSEYDVLITENLFGDILTDEASVISGSMGLMPSASVGSEVSLFEPIHGSYPQAAGKNIANPLATVLSAAMMFETGFGLKEEGQAIRDAVNRSLAEGVVTEDLSEGSKAFSTSEVGDWLARSI